MGPRCLVWHLNLSYRGRSKGLGALSSSSSSPSSSDYWCHQSLSASSSSGSYYDCDSYCCFGRYSVDYCVHIVPIVLIIPVSLLLIIVVIIVLVSFLVLIINLIVAVVVVVLRIRVPILIIVVAKFVVFSFACFPCCCYASSY